VPAAAEPIEPEAFAVALTALGPFEAAPHLVLAVSGGADSLALTILTAGWLATHGGRATALTVDHGLRPAAAAEAAWVAETMRRLGLPHRTLSLRAAARGASSQARARAARYRLLDTATAELGALHLLTGHHREDNAATVAMRRRRAVGPGLAGMPAIRELERARVLRPLLTFPRARLRATAATLGRGWIEDPSNVDPRFERSHVMPPPTAPAVAGRLALEAAARAWLATHARRRADRVLEFAAVRWQALAPALATEVLARVTACVGGAPGPGPGRARVEAAALRLRAGARRLTIAGALVGRVGDRLVVSPERATFTRRRGTRAFGPALADAPFAAPHVVADAALLIC